MTNNQTNIQTDEDFNAWVDVSNVLYWAVVFTGTSSIPVLCHTLYQMIYKYHKSQYFVFLTTIIILDLAMLATIILNVISDILPYMKGNFICKYTAYVANATACHSNWLWVCMYTQRYVYIFYPMYRVVPTGIWSIVNNTKKLLFVSGAFAFMTELWLIFLFKEVKVSVNSQTATFCGPDTDVINEKLIKYIQMLELFVTYFLPFIITILVDFSVIFSSHDSKKFMLVTAEKMGKNSATVRACSSFKIQSEESIKATLLRRQRNIQVCLYIATIQGLLNLPYYLLQILSELLNEFSNVRMNMHPAYLYADAIFYLIFLSQYPLKSLFVYWLHRDWNRNRGSANAYRPMVSKTLSRSEQ